MKTQIPRARLAVFLLAAACALALFVFLNGTFGGPTLLPGTGAPYTLVTAFPDSQNLVRKSLVMYRGVQVGDVDRVNVLHGVARVRFVIYGQYAPLPAGTVVQVDHRTFLQEAYIDVTPGPPGARRLPSGSQVGSIPTVEPDDALQAFDPETRRLLDRGTQTLARGFRAPNAGQELNGTIDGFDQVLTQLRGVTGELRGQEQQLSTLVSAGATVLDAIGQDQGRLSTLIGSGRVVADTFSSQRQAFASGLDQLDRLLARTEQVLPSLPAFLREATPVLRHAAATARALEPALATAAPAIVAAGRLEQDLGTAAGPGAITLGRVDAVQRKLLRLSGPLGAAVANLEPIMRYLNSQVPGWEAMIGNGADAVSGGDNLGPWMQSFLGSADNPATGSPSPCGSAGGLCVNPYPGSGDGYDPRPYVKGTYPRLKPYYPR